MYLVSLEGYLSGTMKNRCWGIASGGIGHQRSLKVTNQGHVTKKGDFTKNLARVCVWYDWIGHIPESMDNGCWTVGSGDIGQKR